MHRELAAELVPIRRADDEEVNVTPELILSRGVRTEEKRKLDTADRREPTAKTVGETGSATDDLAHGRRELSVAG